jgi:hypothetical protein
MTPTMQAAKKPDPNSVAVATKCRLSWPLVARLQNVRTTLLGGGISSSFSSRARAQISHIATPATTRDSAAGECRPRFHRPTIDGATQGADRKSKMRQLSSSTRKPVGVCRCC